MTMEVLVRKAVRQDADAIAEHWMDFKDLFAGKVELDMTMVPDAQARFKRFVLKCIRSRNSRVAVAERGGKVVGYIIGTILKRAPVYKTRNQAFVTDMYLAKGERSKGTGKRLMDVMAGWAIKKGLKLMALYVHPENAGAIRFYNRLGFRPVFYNMVKRL